MKCEFCKKEHKENKTARCKRCGEIKEVGVCEGWGNYQICDNCWTGDD